MNVGQRIREAREELGMQRTVLARRLGVASNTVWRYESGEREPSMAMLERVARELHTEPAELLREPPVLAGAVQHHAGVEDERSGHHDDSRIRKRVDLLESAAELWQRFTNDGRHNLTRIPLGDLRAIDAVSLSIVLDHERDAREMKRSCTAEQRERLEQAERHLFDANREFWDRVENVLAQRREITDIDDFKAQRAEWERASRSSRRA